MSSTGQIHFNIPKLEKETYLTWCRQNNVSMTDDLIQHIKNCNKNVKSYEYHDKQAKKHFEEYKKHIAERDALEEYRKEEKSEMIDEIIKKFCTKYIVGSGVANFCNLDSPQPTYLKKAGDLVERYEQLDSIESVFKIAREYIAKNGYKEKEVHAYH